MYGLMLAARSAEVFTGGLFQAAIFGGTFGLIVGIIYLGLKNWKKKK